MIESDVLKYKFPSQVNGILSTWVPQFIPDCSKLIMNGCKALAHSGYWAIADMKIPDKLPNWVLALHVAGYRPFGATKEMILEKRCETIKDLFSKYLVNPIWLEKYLGFVYIAGGKVNHDVFSKTPNRKT